MVKCKFLSLLKICQTTRVELCSPSLSFNNWFFSFTNRCTSSVISFMNDMCQFIQHIHERDPLSFRLKSKSVSEGRIRSLHSTNHTLRLISYSNAIGSRFSQSLTGWNSPQTRANSATLLWREGFQWTRNMSQWITWTRTIRSPKRFVQKERFVHERNITIWLVKVGLTPNGVFNEAEAVYSSLNPQIWTTIYLLNFSIIIAPLFHHYNLPLFIWTDLTCLMRNTIKNVQPMCI